MKQSPETIAKKISATTGLKRSAETKNKIAEANSRKYMIIFKDGTYHLTKGLKKYALENNIPYVTLHKAFTNQNPVHKYNINQVIWY